MKIDLNKPVFARLKFVEAESFNCTHCNLASSTKSCRPFNLPCKGGHWEIDEVLPQSNITFDMLQIQDSINSVDAKMGQLKSEMNQVKNETEESFKYFY